VDEILVHQEASGRVGIVTLNRPARFNALTIESYQEAGRAVRDLDAKGCTVIVVRCEGPNFCTGGDLSIIDSAAVDRETLLSVMAEFNVAAYRLFSALDETSATVVSAIRGYCLAGGLIISLLSDVVIADTTARFGVPESGVGIGDPFVPARLPRRVGDIRARDMMLTGRQVDAPTAVTWGLATETCEPADLDRRVETRVNDILRLSSYSRAFYKGHLLATLPPLAPAPDASTDDQTVEGVSAFMQKRSPDWIADLKDNWLESTLAESDR
jgi:enoyl-CoA hydratase/carnithine racemase